MNCGFCEHTDGLIYTSNPPKVKCTITGEYHFTHNECVVEFAPVKHGRWTDVHVSLVDSDGASRYGRLGFQCSVCGAETVYITPYCPNCGARMDERREDE